jgi:hypothetical protein
LAEHASRRRALSLLAGGMGASVLTAPVAAKKKRKNRKNRRNTPNAAGPPYAFVRSWPTDDAGGLALSGPDTLYLAGDNEIVKYTTSGTRVTSWGSLGVETGKFSLVRDVAVDAAGNVYAVDVNNHRIQKFRGDGTFVTAWGGRGSKSGEFLFPWGVAVDGAANVYVADPDNARIQKFDADGGFVTAWGQQGSGPGEFESIGDIAVASDGTVFVADYQDDDDQRIQIFSSTGVFRGQWRSNGSGRGGNWDVVYGMAVAGRGVVYVSDGEYERILVFGAKR